MQVQSLGLEDHLEEGMVTHSSILVWRDKYSCHGQRSLVGSQTAGHDRSDLAQHNLKYKNSDYSWEEYGKGWIGK